MSKKRRKSQTRRPNLPSGPLPSSAMKTEQAASDRYGRSYSFEPDYSHVEKDLKRIGFLAGTFIFLLIVGSFFVR